MPGNNPNSRPTAGWLIILCICICGICAPALAETVVIDDSGYHDAYGDYPASADGSYAPGGATLNTLKFGKIENCRGMNAFRAIGVQGVGFYSFPDGPQSFEVEYLIGGTSVGYGRYGTFKVGSTGYIWLSFDSWDVSSYTGTQTVTINKLEQSGIFPTVYNIINSGGSWTPDTNHKVWFFISPYSNVPLLDYEVYYSDSFENTYTVNIDDDTGWGHLSLIRNIGGKAYPSSLYLKTPELTYSTGTILQSNDVEISYIEGSPIEVGIKSSSGVWYNRTFTATGSTDPTTATTTIYVQSSQTGALLADAHLSILAATGGTETEIINATLPAGTGTYTLQPTGGGIPNPDYYRAVATVPGYTQIIENHSFTLNGPHDVIIEMRPDTGGPLDPDRAYLEFYVRDFSANGIAGASVQCNNQVKQTNSKGYVLFEVSKNATYPYTVKKSGYVTIEGTATVADGPRYVANVVLGPGTVPTYTPTLGPGETPGGPGATPTPDTRTNEQKGQAIIDLIADFAEPIAILAILATIFGLMKMMTPGRR